MCKSWAKWKREYNKEGVKRRVEKTRGARSQRCVCVPSALGAMQHKNRCRCCINKQNNTLSLSLSPRSLLFAPIRFQFSTQTLISTWYFSLLSWCNFDIFQYYFQTNPPDLKMVWVAGGVLHKISIYQNVWQNNFQCLAAPSSMQSFA